jgi:hypothetical protein
MKQLSLEPDERLADAVDPAEWDIEDVVYRQGSTEYKLSRSESHTCDECGEEFVSKEALAGHSNAHN